MKKRIANKAIILYVLNVLKAYSSKEFPVSQSAICNYLNDIHVPCDRKTIGRNIVYLQTYGYPIIKISGKGFYLDMERMQEIDDMLIK